MTTTMDPNANIDASEKGDILQSEISSGKSAPGVYDELPDPDVGKTAEERAKLVRI